MSNAVPEEVKRNVRAVLLSKVGGVPLGMFVKDYKSLVLERLDYKDLGFETLQAFLKSMPEIARLEKNGTDIKVFGVGDPNTYLPVGARKAQGKLPKDYHKKLRADAEAVEESTSTDMELLPDLEIDHLGWFSLCCPIDKAPTTDKNELETLFLQAGNPVKIHLSPRWVFVRYKTKEECAKALDVFGEECSLQVASKQKPSNGSTVDENANQKPAQKSEKRARGSKFGRDRGNDAGYMTDTDSRRQQQKSGKKLNGHLSKNGPQENGLKKQKHEGTDRSLYVHGISDEDAFRKLIEPYKPEFIKLVSHRNGWIGFLEMKTAEEANNTIAELNHTQLGDKYIIVDHHTPKEGNQEIKSPTASERGDSQSPLKKNKKSPQKLPSLETPKVPSDFENMPPLQQETHTVQGSNNVKKPSTWKKNATPSEFADMPLLAPESSLGQSTNYYMDCTVFVGNFPSTTTYVALQETFSKYHVRDIIIGNTSRLEGCTRAFLYLSSVYDVIQCVEEMNSHVMDGCALKVDVPYKNEKMRFILKNRLRLKMLH